MPHAILPGSFDPPTNGHVDVFRRASALFDEVTIAIGTNPSKASAAKRLFSPEERVDLVNAVVADLGNVEAVGFSGLLADFAVSRGAVTVVKGVRDVTDYTYEVPQAGMNRHLVGIDTVLLPGAPEWAHVSSSLVKEVALLGGDVSALLPEVVLAEFQARIAARRESR